MEDKTLLVFAIGTALTGILALGILSSILKLEDTKNLENEALGKKASVSGKVLSIDTRKNVTILTISSLCEVEGVFFEERPPIAKGDRVRILGTVQEYKGKREIIIEKIEAIS